MFDFLSQLFKPNQNMLQAQQPQAGNMLQQPTQVAQAQAQPSLMDRYRGFVDSPRGQTLNDMFTGWAMGGTPQQSLGLGAQMVRQGKQTQKQKEQTNQTVDWLKGKGLDDTQAKLIASQPAVLSDYLKQMMDPNAALDTQYRQAQIQNIQSQINERNNPNARDKFGNSVIWGQDENGDWVAMQPSSGGGLVPASTPDGIKLSPPGISSLNLGTQFGNRDRNGNIINTVPIDNAGKAADVATGKAQGEAVASYKSMSSKLPGLEKVVGDLDKLADQATYTKAGQARDWLMRETGMEPTDAAVARTKYISMVDNQILPLLRDTFGAQFTVQEGESLRATLGDPNKTPQEKKEVLRSFIDQKKRDVQALAVQGGIEQPSGGGVVDYRDYFGSQ